MPNFSKIAKEASDSLKKKNFFKKEEFEDKLTIEKDENDLENHHSWKKEKETKFLNERNDCRKVLKDKIRSSSWNTPTFNRLLQDSFLEDKNKEKRNKLLDKFSEGGILNDNELEYLVNTNFLLNSCIDHELIQEASNLLDESVLHNV